MNVFQIIESVAAIGSTTTKKAIIEKNKTNKLLEKCFYYAENNRLNFYTKYIGQDLKVAGDREITVEDVLQLDRLVSREFTGNRAKDFIDDLMEPLNKESRILLGRLISRDLRCGAGTSIANKVWKNLIPEYPCYLAGKFDAKGIEFLRKFEGPKAYIVQTKCDGGRVNIQVDIERNVTVYSRAGNILNMYGQFDALKAYPGFVFDGEVLVRTATGVEDRKTGNGFFTKAVRGTLTKAEAERMSVVLWDMIPMADFNTGVGKDSYEARLAFLGAAIACANDSCITLVKTETADTVDEVIAFYEQERANGEEGAIVKVAKGVWENKRSKYMLKMKAEETADLLCTGVIPGRGKYEGMIGALECQTREGGLEVAVGTGLTDDDRAKDPKEFINRVIEVGYNEIISARGREKKCLFLPVYKQIRYDKKEANLLKELK